MICYDPLNGCCGICTVRSSNVYVWRLWKLSKLWAGDTVFSTGNESTPTRSGTKQLQTQPRITTMIGFTRSLDEPRNTAAEVQLRAFHPSFRSPWHKALPETCQEFYTGLSPVPSGYIWYISDIKWYEYYQLHHVSPWFTMFHNDPPSRNRLFHHFGPPRLGSSTPCSGGTFVDGTLCGGVVQGHQLLLNLTGTQRYSK